MAIAKTAKFMFLPVVLSENSPNTSPIATHWDHQPIEPSEERDERDQRGDESHDSDKRGDKIHRHEPLAERRSMLINGRTSAGWPGRLTGWAPPMVGNKPMPRRALS